jgi:hypothetical protein
MRATDNKKKVLSPTAQRRMLLKAKDTAAEAMSYSSTNRYEAGDVLQHAVFGIGVATAVKDGTKIEVLFDSGSKVLIHAR